MATTVHFDESEDILDIRFDNVFKAVFTKESSASKIALSRLVSAIIGRDVSVLTLAANEPAPESLRDRQLRFDINCRTKDGELVNVEMSLNPDPFEPVRLEFHAAKLFIGQDIRGDDKTYDDLKRAYQIAILVKERFFDDEDFLHTFEYYDPIRGVSLGGRTQITTLELSKVETVAMKSVSEMSNAEQWAVFFQYLTDLGMRETINALVKQEEGIALASEVLMTISRNELERMKLNSELKGILDAQSRNAYHAKIVKHAKQVELDLQQAVQQAQQAEQKRKELLALIDKGVSMEDLRRELLTQ